MAAFAVLSWAHMSPWRRFLNHFFPSRYNAHRPHILKREWLVALLAIILVSEGIIVGQVMVKEGPDVFLAAVVRSAIISFTEEARAAQGGEVLLESEVLNAAAQAKAEDMAARGYFSHVGPDGEEPWVWLERAGYAYTAAGENLAVRFNDSKDVVDAWMASPTHRANIVKPIYQEIGIGVAEGQYKGSRATFVVQYFGTPMGAAAMVPPSDTESLAVAAATSIPEVAPEAVVAGAQASAPQTYIQQSLRFVSKAFSSMGTGAYWALAGVTTLLAVVIALTFFIRIQVQPTDLLVPAVAVMLIAVTLLSANARFLPGATLAASATLAGAGDIGEAAATQRVIVGQ